MNSAEFLAGFQVRFNNITSNQAPGLNVHEISIFLTQAEYEIVKNRYSANSKGNTLGQGFDDSAKRQSDFSSLMKTAYGVPLTSVAIRAENAGYIIKTGTSINPQYVCQNADRTQLEVVPEQDLGKITRGEDPRIEIRLWETLALGTYPVTYENGGYHILIDDRLWNLSSFIYEPVEITTVRIDSRSQLFTFPSDTFIVITEVYKVNNDTLQVIPLQYEEYTNLMSKPYKRPLKEQAWRLINSGSAESKVVEIIAGPGTDDTVGTYIIRYIRKPKPVIVGDLDGLTIDGYEYGNPEDSDENHKYIMGCELDPSIHEDILQRAVELAKISWTQTGQDNTQAVLQAGQRSE